MEDHLQTEQLEMHPEIALQLGIQQEKKQYDVHPYLKAEIDPQEQPEPVVEEVGAQEQQEVQEEPEAQPVAPVQEAPRDRDWREVRARADEAKHLAREKEQLARELEFYKSQQARPAAPEEDDYRTDTEKRLEKEMHELKQQMARQAQETENAKRQSAIARAEQRLAQDYPDIKEVVSDENIRRLETEYPHLYNSVVASSDVYTVGSAAYEMIMAKGIHKKPVNTLKQIAQSNSISRNQAKPRSASSVSPQAGESPIKQASSWMGNNISSDDERKALYAEMVSYSRNKI